MRSSSSFDFIGNLDTLLAVVIGAVLATGGALIAEIIQDRFGRKRRERDAARFFGEVMSSIDAIIDLAMASRGIGDPWGRVTQRLFETALREAAVYDRNRERVFDIADMQLRFDINAQILRETVPIADLIHQIETARAFTREIETQGLPDRERAGLEAQLAETCQTRENIVESIAYERSRTHLVISRLEALARVKFQMTYNQSLAPDQG